MTTLTLARGTADLCDDHGDRVQVCEPTFHAFGGRRAFHGPISTVRCFEDNSRVKEAVESPGEGRVLVVDGHHRGNAGDPFGPLRRAGTDPLFEQLERGLGRRAVGHAVAAEQRRVRALGMVTPLGGVLFLLGWAAVAAGAWRSEH